jgi:putative endonuclease
MRPCVYILASGKHGTLYTGVTSDLAQRIWQHRNDVVAGFTSRYGVHVLVHVEFHATMIDAITREKQIKKWRRA